MMQLRPIQQNFTAGEWSPRLFGRSDLSKYFNALESLENFIILPYGGVARRDGLHYVVAQGDETRKARLIPFVFSTEQAYIIEAGHKYMRFFMNHGQIQEDEPDDVLLLHMDGMDGSQTFLDSSPSGHTVTAESITQIDTAEQKFGSGSGLFYGGVLACHLTIPDHADFDFSADDIFTIECWIKYSSTAGTIFSHSTDANNGVYLDHDGSQNLTFGVGNAGAWQTLTTTTMPITSLGWTHVRVVGDGTSYFLFVNGHLEVGQGITSHLQDFTGDFIIGGDFAGTAYFYGWMDEFRITDAAVATDDFVPPASQYPHTTPYEIATPYLEEDLPLLKYFQSFDTMYIFHPDHAWRKLTRTGHAAWSLDVVDHTNGPWLDVKDDIVFTPSAAVGDIDLTSVGDFFQGGHVGALLRLYINGAWGYVKITAVTTVRIATATVIVTLGDVAASTKYQEGAWSGVNGYPSAGAFNEESLVAVANNNQPQTAWASQKGDYENFKAGADDADAFIYTIPASNRILWLGALRELVLGTGDGTYKMTGGMDDFISPTNVRVRPGMAIGAKNVDPIRVNNSLLYWQKGGRKLRELTYDPNSFDEGYVAPDLSLLADHMTLGGIKYSAWQQEPNSILWSVRTDGALLAMTYMRPEEIVGWGRHITDGKIESVAVIPDPTDSFNEVWATVKRTVLDIDSDTALLLRMNGDDESTSFPDSSASAHVVTAHGGAEIDTARSKFGGSSGLFALADEGYLTIHDHADFDFSADNIFTIEFWTYQSTLASAGVIAQTTDSDHWFHIFLWLNGHISFIVTDTTSQIVDTAAGVLTAATWQHIRVVGDGSNYYIFLDGELLVTEAITHNMQNFTGDLTIGRNAAAGGTYYGGWLDALKISNVARSTANFAPPASEFAERRYIEYMDPDMMVDSGLIYSGVAVSSVSGLAHLEGKTVDIVADGVVYDQTEVASGAVAIDPAASEIRVGLPYTSKLVTMKPIINSERGTTAGLPKKWAEVFVSVHETSGLKINNEVIDFRRFSDVALGEEIPLYTGNIQVSQLGWGDGRIELIHSGPLPCTILGIFGTLEISD